MALKYQRKLWKWKSRPLFFQLQNTNLVLIQGKSPLWKRMGGSGWCYFLVINTAILWAPFIHHEAHESFTHHTDNIKEHIGPISLLLSFWLSSSSGVLAVVAAGQVFLNTLWNYVAFFHTLINRWLVFLHSFMDIHEDYIMSGQQPRCSMTTEQKFIHCSLKKSHLQQVYVCLPRGH